MNNKISIYFIWLALVIQFCMPTYSFWSYNYRLLGRKVGAYLASLSLDGIDHFVNQTTLSILRENNKNRQLAIYKSSYDYINLKVGDPFILSSEIPELAALLKPSGANMRFHVLIDKNFDQESGKVHY